MLKTRTSRLTVSSMLCALGLILPYSTAHAFGVSGTVLLPMHIPVLLAGMLCGRFYGLACGIIIPLLNSLLTGMPALYPMLPIMTGELAIYGFASGVLSSDRCFGRMRFGAYPALIISMICGRLAYAGVFYLLVACFGELKAPTVFAAIVTGIPGIVVQILLIPPITLAIGKGRTMRKNEVASAINLINEGTAACVVLRDGCIIHSEKGDGIAPIIRAYELSQLKGTLVVDKIVGKAAAMVMTLGEVSSVHGKVMSRAGMEYLVSHGIEASADEVVETIENRRKDGMCPMEETVLFIDDPREALDALKNKIESLREQKNDKG